MYVLGDACCAVYFANYIYALQGAGEADVKRDLDYSTFSEITRYQTMPECNNDT